MRISITVETTKAILAMIALSAILLWVSHTTTFGTFLQENIDNEFRLIQGKPFMSGGKPLVIPAFYNRILFPGIFLLMTKILPSLSDVQVFLGLRFLSFLFCLTTIYVAANRRWQSSTSDPLMVSSVISLSMIPTFNHTALHSNDIFDLTFCFFMFLYVVEGKFLPAFLVACLTAINRETGAFAAIAYVCITFGKEKYQLMAVRAGMLALIPYLAAVLVRKLVLGSQLPITSTGQWYTGFSYNLGLLLEALKRPLQVAWPILLFAMLVLPWLMFLRRCTIPDFRFRVACAFLTIFVITAAVGINSEVRTFIPCAALLMACAVAVPDPRLTIERNSTSTYPNKLKRFEGSEF